MAIIDKIKGIFTNQSDVEVNKNINDDKQQEIFDMVYGDYQYFKGPRQAQEDWWRKEQRFYNGDHWYGLRPAEVSQQRPNSVDNVYWSQIESIVSRLTGWEPTMDFESQEPRDEEKSKLLNDFIPYDLRCIKFHQKHIRAVRRLIVHGTILYKSVFDPTIIGGHGNNRYVGQNDIIPMDLGTFFPDPRIRDFIYLQQAQANIVKTNPSLAYFKQRFGKRGELVTQDNTSADDEIFSNQSQTSLQFNTSSYGNNNLEQTQRAGLIEYWYKGKPMMVSAKDKELFKQEADEKLAQGIDPSIYLQRIKGEMDGIHCIYIATSGAFLEHTSYVYDHGQYPFVARTLFPNEESPWGKGYGRDMISPQIMLNKHSELTIEMLAKLGNGAIMYEEDAIPKPVTFARKRSTPGAMLPVARLDGVQEMEGMTVPQGVFQGMEYYKDMLQKIPGQFDSANGQASTNVTSGTQANALINASEGRLSLPAEIIKDALQEVMMQFISLAAQFYKQERILRITGGQTAFSRDKMMSQAPTTYDAGQGQMQVVEEYVPDFDIKINIGAEKPQDREYWVQSALTLLQTIDPMTQMPMIDAKAVQYTIQNGRMEPMQVIQDRMQTEQQQLQKIQELEQENAVLNEMVTQMNEQLQGGIAGCKRTK